MQSLWNAADAAAMVAHYAGRGVSEDLALRVYSSRLLGSDPRLVQHGGGNTSVKTREPDATGTDVPVLRVKGSGWDLGDIEPAGLPALRMEALLALTCVAHMSDGAMVNALRGAMLDASAPNPSVETLLHAWVPAKVIDHTHANAVLAVTDLPDGEARAVDLFAADLVVCPYVMPGYGLAHQVRTAAAARPDAIGAILLKHGIFTWGADAREAYERMIAMVARAEAMIARGARVVVSRPAPARDPLAFLPELRGALSRGADGAVRRMVLDLRDGADLLEALDHPDLLRVWSQNPVTPDHVLRTKPTPLILPPDEADIAGAVARFRADYAAYFARNAPRSADPLTMLDPSPRVVLAPGAGLIGVAARAGEAAISADVARTNLAVRADAERMGPYEGLPEADIFDVEYWSLEQAKLGKAKPPRLAGHVVAVTGAASGIGAATAKAFAAEGAEVCVLDRDEAGAAAVARAVKGHAVACDVTDAASVAAAFAAIVRRHGGLDILVSNAGAAFQGRIGAVDEAVLRESFELNFFAHQRVAKAATAIFLRQGIGGVLLFNASKQALNPGPDFGPYGLPKAALLALMRQYAVDHGKDGVRSNAVNADRIRSGLLTDEMIAERSRARGLSEADYMGGNLLGAEVRAEDVAQAFVTLALAERTTGAILTVDGGNVAAAVR
jgi:rhamnose utilization protein RhaD (predicted bifunctional aldolase and dehydrogenase)/NAD(P)-dependent dehydrogenase (short-subunit alcohol dehydrogenase family)